MVIFAGLAHMIGLFTAFNYVHTYENLAPQKSNIVVAAYPQNLVKTPSLTR